MNKTYSSMKQIVQDYDSEIVPFKQGDVVEVKVLSVSKHRILVDVAGLTTGIVPEREFSVDSADLKIGDKILAYAMVLENSEGYVVLSLRRADRERLWRTLSEKQQEGEQITIKITGANRGGLLANYGGLAGFLPVSQLASTNYPRVDGNQEEIVRRLKNLVGKNLRVKVLTCDRTTNKLIFSEKAAGDQALEQELEKYKVDDVAEGVISGIVDFGLFVNLGNIEGLVYISEVSWDKVENLNELFKVGEKIKVLVIDKQASRLSLSLKRLQPDPWLDKVSKYKVGQAVEAKIIKITPFGAFVQLEEGIEGLVHISELGEKVINPTEVVEVGKNYKFKILAIEPDSHKMNLSLKALLQKAESESLEKTTATKKKVEKKTSVKISVKSSPKKTVQKKVGKGS